jgi:DNA-binding IclR family transcriptional regulator
MSYAAVPRRDLDCEVVGEFEETKSPGIVRSVDRAVSILEFLARNGWSGVTDLGHELGVHKSTAFRLLNTLEARGLVEQHVDSGKYRIGHGVAHLAQAVTVGPDIRQQARPSCEWLAERTEETITLSVLSGDEVVTIDQILSPSMVASRSWLGRRIPLHCTSPGKIFFASLPKKVREELLAGPHERRTDSTIVGAKALRKEIQRAADDGYAVAIDEFEDGLSSASAPILAMDGSVIAAICVSGPSQRLDADRLRELEPVVKEAAGKASAISGG